MAKRKKKSSRKSKASGRRWSQRVTETSDAMTLEEGVFKKPSPRAIARSVMRSAEHSHRRKSAPYRSAMSMLTFYINRAGKGLSKEEKRKLEKAKDELRALRPARSKARKTHKKTARKGMKSRKRRSG